MKLKFLSIALLLVVGCSATPKVEESAQSVSSEAPAQVNTTFTKAQYEQVESGMTLAEAQKVFGAPGEEVTQSETQVMGQKLVMVVHTWRNPDFSNATLTLENGKVSAKAQMNLK